MRLVVAIATYNGRHLLEQVLGSFVNQTRPADRLIVVDDASSDDTVAWLAEHWPEVEVIAHPQNRGITAALNTCLNAGLEADWVGLFNNDVELAPDALELLCASLAANPAVAATGPKMLNYHDRTRLDGAGDVYFANGTSQRRGHGERDDGQYDQPEECFGVCGGAALYRVAALRELGLFDPRYGAYLEDVDWALRANLAGRHCFYEPRAVVFHMGSASTGGSAPSAFSQYYLWRNGLWMLAKYWTAGDVLRNLPGLVLAQIWCVYVAARYRLLGVLWHAWRDALRELPAVLSGRQPGLTGVSTLGLPHPRLPNPLAGLRR
jgi:GT2 family glycosyltransferase